MIDEEIDNTRLGETAKRVTVDITDNGDKHLANTTHLMPPWKPGESGNPKGRPKDIKYISEALKDLLAKDPILLKEVVQAMLKEVKTGNIPALKELLDRTEGKVTENIEVKGQILVTPDMRALAARELIEVKEEETKLLEG